MQCIEGCLLYIPKYAREVASGKFSVSCNCKKLPVIKEIARMYRVDRNQQSVQEI